MRPWRTVRPLLLLGLAAATGACASLPAALPRRLDVRVAVLTPRDGVPIRSRDALPGDPASDDLLAARAAAMAALRSDLAAALRERGLEVVEVEADAAASPQPRPEAVLLADRGHAAGAVAAIDTELIAYGDIRRSWLWVLGAQALAAGIGHGVVVQSATGNSTLAWEAGGAEFLVETATWVGGALVGGLSIDPVLVRVRLVDTRTGAVLHRWTREGTRPWRQWLRRKGLPPRAARLRGVADGVFARLAPKLVRALEPRRHARHRLPPEVPVFSAQRR